MSSPLRSPSPAGSLQSALSDVLTPSRKVRALLAQFDESDSDDPIQGSRPPVLEKSDQRENGRGPAGQDSVSPMEDESEEEDILHAAPRSRIAARLQGSINISTVSNGIEKQSSSNPHQEDTSNASDEGKGARPPMRRRLLTKRKSSPIRQAAQSLASPSPSQSTLPSLGAISPAAGAGHASGGSESEDEDKPSNTGKSKFLALVEKHRKQRLEKEAEEAAKKAARVEALKSQEAEARIPRGSSPADDSDEDSDISGDDAAKKLAKQARPTRKASKKAIEEMNRETQRLTRNMQLAHQARTKKKITKDSLLARFNFPKPGSMQIKTTPEPDNETPVTASSRAGSDTDAVREHDTPPTSPVAGETTTLDSFKNPRSNVDGLLRESGNTEEDSVAPLPKLDKGKGRALSEEPIEHRKRFGAVHQVNQQTSNSLLEASSEPPLKPTVKPFRPKWSLAALKSGDDDDSDSELEVITTRGDVRKYAVFEHLPKRKATESSSHLALRSLANLIGSEERKNSLNAAQLEISLRRAARMQAQRERQEKIQELKAKGVMIQTAEEREREQQEVEDLLERARQEAVEIQKREKAMAKKEGTLSKDDLDDDDDDDGSDGDFEGDDEDEIALSDEDEEDGEGEGDDDDDEMDEAQGTEDENLVEHEAAEEDPVEAVSEDELETASGPGDDLDDKQDRKASSRRSRTTRVLSDDDEEAEEVVPEAHESPRLPSLAKTPQSLSRSARKQIPGLQMSDDLPMGLTQAFAATMADSQSQPTQEQDSLTMTVDLPSPNIAMVPRLNRLDSVDMISDSQPDSQTQPLNINLSFSQSQRIPQSPANASATDGPQYTPSQAQFEPTQDAGYVLTPFGGNRFSTDTPQQPAPHSTMDTVLLPPDTQESPIVQRKSRLQRGRPEPAGSDDEKSETAEAFSAFDAMRLAAKQKKREMFDKSKSNAREIVDEAAEESEDEYAGLGGASDEDANDEENEDDRNMIDEDTQVGAGDEAKLAKLFADRERQQDEAAVSKLLKDITTGALRRKRGNDDLDLSDEEDAIMRRRAAKRREFLRMRNELLKDEAVGKIAEDKKKEAFLRSIEDLNASDDDEDDFDLPETQTEDESQTSAQAAEQSDRPGDLSTNDSALESNNDKRAFASTAPSRLNQARRPVDHGRAHLNRRPTTLAEIRESVSFLVEERDSQSATIDLGLSDSEDEPEAYVNLDRHLQAAEADENADNGEDLGDFIVDDDGRADDESAFKKPTVPYSETRAAFSDRRTKERPNVVNRLSMLRQSSSSSGSSTSTKMAFYGANSSANRSIGKVPTLLRRATTNSSLGSMAGRDENVSATGVVTNRTERGKGNDEKEFIRKGNGGRRNAVNYRPTIREEKMSQRAGIAKKNAAKNKKAKGGFLGGLFGQNSWA
ncbi:hypothetical protein A1O1_00889 [Capronia coronata CBS 617.96]|uniref:DNA replication checkpoint mediator MRC1 domain-containing protein n=1 Tax=Capronia coronata CBS 617.96 TaxID=1182541 RepID=W9Z1C6_9EURO|nr:uncharacterized protein A1O1_00889 [Capronia coronata CBS 617.96]EXJ95765.1 hypothetical protein A1O1_00889 [Capronia coronata CBS 617.96]